MSSTDKEVAVDKVEANEKADAKAEVKGTKRQAEEKEEKQGDQPPSAPIEEEHHVGAPPTHQYPTLPTPTNPPYPAQNNAPYPTQNNPPYPTSTSSPPTYGATNTGNDGDFHQPPPSYQDALNYPQMPPQSQMPKPYTPQTEVPHHGAYHHPQQNSSVYAGAPLGNPQGHYNPQPQVVHTVITTTHPGGNCIWCRQGNVENETDMCCLICLILLAICTFPFGLVLLCCIPCSVRPRCNRCRRLQD